MKRPHILIAVGARPNFMKAAPLIRALRKTRRAKVTLVHTGQHYDPDLSAVFFRDLKLPPPRINLRAGSGSHSAQTAAILQRFEPVLEKLRPDAVVVVGDVNSTLACALAAWKMPYRPWVVHVEAGLRSFDRSMPEEANRKLTDHLADLLFAPSPDAVANLRREGIPARRIFFAGNVMIDSLRAVQGRARSSRALQRLGLRPRQYALVTLHRPSNVDDPKAARPIVSALRRLSQRLPVVFPLHPRTRKLWRRNGLLGALQRLPGILLTPPMGYLDFACLLSHARLVLTDSGGIQEETTILKVPCLTLRRSTERPVTITHGTNRLVGGAAAEILRACRTVLKTGRAKSRIPARWDGHAADRIARVLLRHCGTLSKK